MWEKNTRKKVEVKRLELSDTYLAKVVRLPFCYTPKNGKHLSFFQPYRNRLKLLLVFLYLYISNIKFEKMK